jgi:hypothetical protein
VHVGGSVVPVAVHDHGDGRPHAHPAAAAIHEGPCQPAAAPSREDAPEPDDPAHGHGAFAHFSAFVAPAASVVTLVPRWSVRAAVPVPRARAATPPLVRLAVPRGPPSA